MRRTVADFLDRHADIRTAMTNADGYDRELWRRGVDELGVSALLVPERCGGLGMSFADGAVLVAEFGRRLVPSPLLDTVVATAVLAACGTDEADWLLTEIATEGLSVAVAFAEPEAGWCADSLASRAASHSAGWTLRGAKEYVAHGATADLLLVPARTTEGELRLYVTRASDAGLRRTSRTALDHTRTLAEIEFTDAVAVRVDGSAGGADSVALLSGLMLTALAVESAAAARSCLSGIVTYLSVRQQFGRALGSFQALKHRCADLAVRVAGAEATAWYATESVGNGAQAATTPELAKVVCADALLRVAAESVQLHGGIGFTFDHDAHLFLKRGKANQLLFGSGQQLRTRVAEAAGLGT